MTAGHLQVVILTRAVHPWHGVGGLERHTGDLVRHLLARDVRVSLVMPPPRGAAGNDDVARDSRLTTHVVPYRTFPFAGRRGTTVLDRSTAYPLFGWRAGRLAQRLVAKGGVQIVHGMGAAVLGYARARARDRLGTVPLVLNPQGMEEFGATDPSRARLKRLAYRPLQAAVRTCAAAADRVLATDAVLLPVVLRHLPVAPERVRVMPNAVDLERVDTLARRVAGGASELRGTCGVGDDDHLMVAAGRLESNKGFDILIRALAQLATARRKAPRWHLVIIGDGPRRRTLQRQALAAGLGECIHLVGRLPDADVHAWFAAATFFVHPTLYEGSSLVTLEAMAHRRAVVATTAGGIPDKVTPGVTGWLVPPGDVRALAAALRSALANRDRLPAMGRAGRAAVEQRFSWTAVTDQLLALYEELLARG